MECVADFIAGAGTILCGLANSMESLIAARALAGMGGGGYVPMSITIHIH